MGRGTDRALGLGSIAAGLLATVVLGVAVSTDYWLYTDEPIDTGIMPDVEEAGAQAEEDDDEVVQP